MVANPQNQRTMHDTMAEVLLSAEEQDNRYLPLLDELQPVFEAGYEDMPFHNWQHAQNVASEMVTERTYLQENNVVEETGMFVDIVTGWAHDRRLIAFQRSLLAGKRLARSAEEYAAQGTDFILRRRGIDTFTRSKIKDGIRATELGAACLTTQQKKARRTDLKNITGDYIEDFLENMNKLREERKLVTGSDMTLSEYKDISLSILSQYLSQDLSYGDFDKPDGRHSIFQLRAAANLRRLAEERASEAGLSVIMYAKKLGNPVLRVVGLELAA